MTKERLDEIPILPAATIEYVAGMCEALSDHTGTVVAQISGRKGKPVVRFKREKSELSSIPGFLRQSE